MNVSTRTSEGCPCNCPVCGKQMVVIMCQPLGDATCPHCGALVYPRLQHGQLAGDDERRLADLGVLIETDDQGNITVAELHGPRFNDTAIPTLAMLKDVPRIKLNKTGFTEQGVERLRSQLPETDIEEVSSR